MPVIPTSDLLSGVTLSPSAQVAFFSLHALISLLLLLLQRTRFASPVQQVKVSGRIESVTMQQFGRRWQWLWIGWSVMYSWLAVKAVVALQGVEMLKPLAQSTTDAMMCINGFILFDAFLVLDEDSVNLPADPNRNRPYLKGAIGYAVLGLAIYALAFCERFQLLSLHGIGVICVGVYCGVGMAFFVTPFCNIWMDAPRWLLIFLYSYAMFQVTYSFFHLEPVAQAVVYVIVMILKLVLWVGVTYLCGNGNVARYLQETRQWKQSFASRQRDQIISEVHDRALNEQLDGALEMVEQNNLSAAAVMASLALESYLKRLWSVHFPGEPYDKQPLGEAVNKLKRRGVFDEPRAKEINWAIAVRKQCLHTGNGTPRREDVKDMIAVVRKVIALGGM